ncbi:hypothetical protein AB1M95_10195 [Sulfitobacter sp. LCG007]
MTGTIVILSGLVLLLAVGRGLQALRHTEGTERGSEPGEGHHVIEAEYSSGGGGGGQFMRYEIPKDPQEYARIFIPKDGSK